MEREIHGPLEPPQCGLDRLNGRLVDFTEIRRTCQSLIMHDGRSEALQCEPFNIGLRGILGLITDEDDLVEGSSLHGLCNWAEADGFGVLNGTKIREPDPT